MKDSTLTDSESFLMESHERASHELPPDFPHFPPNDYKYKVIRKNSSLLSIWTVYQREFVYNNGDESACIWGFYNPKKREYYAPINATKVGDKVDINSTSPYTAMKLNLNPLMQCLMNQ